MTFLLMSLLCASLDNERIVQAGAEIQATQTAAVSDANTLAEAEYQRLLTEDEAAEAEVEQWVHERHERPAKDKQISEAELKSRIRQRMEPVRRAYEDFLRRHPDHARARVTYGSLLSDLGDSAAAETQWKKALELDRRNGAAYNNLACLCTETGKATQAFDYHSKAVEFGPSESLHHHNFANTLYVFRKTAMEYYGVSEQQIYVKVLRLYRDAFQLAPQNFSYASDLAQTYYSLVPFPAEEAVKAWNEALKIAANEPARQGVYVHLARVKMLAGRFAEARAQLSSVTDSSYSQQKTNLLRAIAQRESAPKPANDAPSSAESRGHLVTPESTTEAR